MSLSLCSLRFNRMRGFMDMDISSAFASKFWIVSNFVKYSAVVSTQSTWDSQAYRKLIDPSYKTNRIRDSLGDLNCEVSSNFCDIAQIPQATYRGYEGDDVIGSLCQSLVNRMDESGSNTPY
eukprot:Platyproteum_vivax@DN10623_c0_g1_i1.p1